jgi:hypothetical protein
MGEGEVKGAGWMNPGPQRHNFFQKDKKIFKILDRLIKKKTFLNVLYFLTIFHLSFVITISNYNYKDAHG